VFVHVIDNSRTGEIKKVIERGNSRVLISPTFYKQFLRQYPFERKLQTQTVIREKPCKTLLYKKTAHTMLVKVTPGRSVAGGLVKTLM